MAKWLIHSLVLAVVVWQLEAAALNDFSCTEREKCETICGKGEGWCLGGWCACARKREIVRGTTCVRDDECANMKCFMVFGTPRCFGGDCRCIPELGK